MNLKKKVGGVFQQFKNVQLNNACKATIEVGTDYNEATYRAFWPKQDADHRQGRSGIHLIQTHP
jgi:hypothetical protein